MGRKAQTHHNIYTFKKIYCLRTKNMNVNMTKVDAQIKFRIEELHGTYLHM